MNIKIYQKLVDLFESLPNFKHYGYYNESIEDVITDDEGHLMEVKFPCGSLKRSTMNVEQEVGSPAFAASRVWTLHNSLDITAVFVIQDLKIIE
tara:strand:+ start:408 stop:689 length:282 start_codon:yes stop_codon:yes gene_type:complete